MHFENESALAGAVADKRALAVRAVDGGADVGAEDADVSEIFAQFGDQPGALAAHAVKIS